MLYGLYGVLIKMQTSIKLISVGIAQLIN